MADTAPPTGIGASRLSVRVWTAYTRDPAEKYRRSPPPVPAASSAGGIVRLSSGVRDGGFTRVSIVCPSRSLQTSTEPSRSGRTPRAGLDPLKRHSPAAVVRTTTPLPAKPYIPDPSTDTGPTRPP